MVYRVHCEEGLLDRERERGNSSVTTAIKAIFTFSEALVVYCTEKQIALGNVKALTQFYTKFKRLSLNATVLMQARKKYPSPGSSCFRFQSLFQ